MTAHVLTWSSFLREPASVEKWLQRGDVLLRRREGETLRLSRESSDNAQREVLRTVAKLASGQPLPDVARRMPWTRFLPAADRAQFVEEFLQTLEACADLGDFTALSRLLDDWKATATLHSQGLAKKLRAPLADTTARVQRP